MCHVSVIKFFINNLDCSEFRDKRVLEVGSKYVNGSVRPLIERFCHSKEYIGVDIEKGKFVDIILPAEKLVEYFGQESFDVVISTKLLEHVKNWRLAVNNMKHVLKSGGYIYITTRSICFPYHGYPYDFWRFEMSNIEKIFSDFEIVVLERDHEAPAVFLKAIKPKNWRMANLEDLAVYSVLQGRRTENIVDINEAPLARRTAIRLLSSKVHWLLPRILVRAIGKLVK